MSNLGMSVMLHRLGGNAETVNAVKKALGQTIDSVNLTEDGLLQFTFTNGYKLNVWDDGQSCCEYRYMTTDDDLSQYAGATLLDIEIAEAPNEVSSGYDEHEVQYEVQFLRVHTDRGIFTMASHNRHNGYYGGFAIAAREGN